MTNEEKILALLEAQGKMLEAHGALLSNLAEDVSGLKQDVSGLKRDVAEIRIDIENRMDPQLQALVEGQKTILESMVPKDRVEDLEEDVDVLKAAFRGLSREVSELKRAQ